MAKLWGRYRYLPYIPCVHTGIAFSILNIFSKMEDLKDIRSTLPARTPKLQLAAEQPLIGECQILSKKDTTCQGAKRKPQQDGRRGEITFRIKPHTSQRCSEGWNKLCAHQDPETPQRLRQNYVWVSPVEVWVSSGLLQRQGLWVQ